MLRRTFLAALGAGVAGTVTAPSTACEAAIIDPRVDWGGWEGWGLRCLGGPMFSSTATTLPMSFSPPSPCRTRVSGYPVWA